jgi:predicted short-subunit dehydrogenase-like oxidoreductase (DUF2520 family)
MTETTGSSAAPGGQRPARLSVGVVGAGRVGAVLGAALSRAGHHVVAASAVSRESRARAAALLPSATVVSPPEVLAVSDLVLLTVPDDVLADLVAGLVATDSIRPGQFLVHTSGRYGVTVLEPATRVKALPLALHPVMTFSGTTADLARLPGASFGVTAPESLRPAAEALVYEIGAEPVWVPEELRPLWHAALAHGANHLVTLVAQSMDLLREAGVAEPARVLAPLLSAALDNALRGGDSALTGPVARGDAGTVAAHVQALAVDAEILRTYRSLARATADRALASGRLRPAEAEALLDALAGPTDEARA